MSTTPVRSALPCSKVGIASGPPRRLICTSPLPSLFTWSTKRTKISPNVVLRGTKTTALSVVSCAAAGSAADRNASSEMSRFIFSSRLIKRFCGRRAAFHYLRFLGSTIYVLPHLLARGAQALRHAAAHFGIAHHVVEEHLPIGAAAAGGVRVHHPDHRHADRAEASGEAVDVRHDLPCERHFARCAGHAERVLHVDHEERG